MLIFIYPPLEGAGGGLNQNSLITFCSQKRRTFCLETGQLCSTQLSQSLLGDKKHRTVYYFLQPKSKQKAFDFVIGNKKDFLS